MSKKCFSGMIRCSLQEAEVGQNSYVDVKTMQDKELKNNTFLMEKKRQQLFYGLGYSQTDHSVCCCCCCCCFFFFLLLFVCFCFYNGDHRNKSTFLNKTFSGVHSIHYGCSMRFIFCRCYFLSYV